MCVYIHKYVTLFCYFLTKIFIAKITFKSHFIENTILQKI